MGLEFGNNAVDYDFDTRILRWFDRYLKDVQNGEDEKPRATYYVVGENEWHTSDDWTPLETKTKNFYISSEGNANSMNGDGKIVLSLPEETGSDKYIYDPAHGRGKKIRQSPREDHQGASRDANSERDRGNRRHPHLHPVEDRTGATDTPQRNLRQDRPRSRGTCS